MSRLEDTIANGNRPDPIGAEWPNSWITCADGTCLSVIAGVGSYCRPAGRFQHSVFPGPFTHVEVMLGNKADEPDSWKEYERMGGVYACVPVDLVREFVAAHGGEA